ncbi:hypothetical protein RRG08_035706 [Elysia crispata]|uniref:Uncharacterized protein n=1 Tax=Elysia crispata TaxID=231223 RepID=A0AAE1D011_9GAST|nr:hypothetical protein RRG08_035706 [Elysia crispata]
MSMLFMSHKRISVMKRNDPRCGMKDVPGDLPDEPDFPPPTVRDLPPEQPQQSTEQPGTSTPTEEARPSTPRAQCPPPPR